VTVDCKEALEQLEACLDPETARELRDRIEAHLAQCPGCRVHIDTVKKTISLYRSEAPLECPEKVRERLHAVLSFEYRRATRG
jgi:anti-sigma factor (TIGR02949 family)